MSPWTECSIKKPAPVRKRASVKCYFLVPKYLFHAQLLHGAYLLHIFSIELFL